MFSYKHKTYLTHFLYHTKYTMNKKMKNISKFEKYMFPYLDSDV